ncbi:unnamed protein product [Heligmosomoides polygyrus]|uniref:Endo/exonuclease/phosphatase domain-containing protein n=1 Tax=Heligmosomoides polygyrus TaxID=6339 RepID=A0A183FYH4_HELPZ|nr:unnamed protein product [Heligmosomoides polygyrus]
MANGTNGHAVHDALSCMGGSHVSLVRKMIISRVAVLRLETKYQSTISIINGYAPTSAATGEEKEEFYKLFERTVNDEKSYYKVVVGDFNATVESGVCLTGCKQPEIERSGRVVVSVEKTSRRQKDHQSIKVTRWLESRHCKARRQDVMRIDVLDDWVHDESNATDVS